MKKHLPALALPGALIATSTMVAAQQMDPNMPGMARTHESKPADAQDSGVVKVKWKTAARTLRLPNLAAKTTVFALESTHEL